MHTLHFFFPHDYYNMWKEISWKKAMFLCLLLETVSVHVVYMCLQHKWNRHTQILYRVRSARVSLFFLHLKPKASKSECWPKDEASIVLHRFIFIPRARKLITLHWTHSSSKMALRRVLFPPLKRPNILMRIFLSSNCCWVCSSSSSLTKANSSLRVFRYSSRAWMDINYMYINVGLAFEMRRAQLGMPMSSHYLTSCHEVIGF